MEKCKECHGQGSWYGMAPHKHDMSETGSIIGSTGLEPDNEERGAGIYVCEKCNGSGWKPEKPK